MAEQPVVLISEAGGPDAVRRFSGLRRIVDTRSADGVVAAVERIEDGVAGGLHAAGFLAYEAAPGLDAALQTREPDGRPLVWFGLFEESELVDRGRLHRFRSTAGDTSTRRTVGWQATMARVQYRRVFAA